MINVLVWSHFEIITHWFRAGDVFRYKNGHNEFYSVHH